MNRPNHPSGKRSLRTNLVFYTVTLLTVLGLFQITTAYGEANLKAPPNLNGRYLTDAAAPGCPTNSRLALTIQQSGRYLNAALELDKASDAARISAPKTLGLRGSWRQQIYLAGSAPDLAACQQPTDLTLEASFQPESAPAQAAPDGAVPAHSLKPSLTGQIQLNGQTWPFTAHQQPPADPQSSH